MQKAQNCEYKAKEKAEILQCTKNYPSENFHFSSTQRAWFVISNNEIPIPAVEIF